MTNTFSKSSFICFCLGQAVSNLSFGIVNIAVVWRVIDVSSSPSMAGLAFMMFYAPAVFLSPVAGVLSDRYNRKRIMLAVDIVRAVIIFHLVFLTSHVDQVSLVIYLIALLSVASAFSVPAENAFVADLGAAKDWESYIPINNTSLHLSRLIGPAIGGGIIATQSIQAALIVSCALFCLAAFLKLFIGTYKIISQREEKASFLSDIIKAWNYLKERRGLLAIFILASLMNFFIMPLSMYLPLFAKDVFKSGANGLAFMEASLVLGLMLGSLSVIYINKCVSDRRTQMSKALFLVAILYSAFGLVDKFILSLPILFILGCAIGFCNSQITIDLHKIIKQEVKGKVFALITSVVTILGVFGFVFWGEVQEYLGIIFGPILSGIGFALLIPWFIKRYQIMNGIVDRKGFTLSQPSLD